jgi:hypothetical protein
MLGLIFLYYIGKSYYDLAGFHDKNQWGYAIFGIVNYYACTFLGGFILAIALALLAPNFLENTSETALGYMALPFGLLGCWGIYAFLKRRWENVVEPVSDSTLLDDTL